MYTIEFRHLSHIFLIDVSFQEMNIHTDTIQLYDWMKDNTFLVDLDLSKSESREEYIKYSKLLRSSLKKKNLVQSVDGDEYESFSGMFLHSS